MLLPSLFSVKSTTEMSPCRSQWPSGLRHWSTAAYLMEFCVRIPPWARMSVCCERCVLSGRGLCVGLITHPEEYYRVWCVWVWSWILDNEKALAHGGCCAMVKRKSVLTLLFCRSERLSYIYITDTSSVLGKEQAFYIERGFRYNFRVYWFQLITKIEDLLYSVWEKGKFLVGPFGILAVH